MASKILLSKQGRLISEDLKKIGTGALMAGVGASLFYLLDGLTGVDFGEQWTPIVVAILGILSNTVRKAASETNYK